MSSCYRFQEIKYADPIFKEVQATYIIHLEGNGRLPAIEEQLKKYHPTETVYILWNKGFKKCQKDPAIDKSPLDLVDAFMQCFKDADEKGYENILILEDDFIFDEKILDPCHARSIEAFLKSKQGDNYVYYLGCASLIQFSTFGNHDRVFSSVGTHSVIYPKTFIKYTLTQYQFEILDYDEYMNKNLFNFSRFKYSNILCYQTFPNTENQTNWGSNYIEKLGVPILLNSILYLKLDRQVQPGYDILNLVSKILFWIILITTIILIFFITSFIGKNFKWLNKKWYYYIYILLGIIILYPVCIALIFILFVIIGRIYNLGFS